jgi:hypothetical protein
MSAVSQHRYIIKARNHDTLTSLSFSPSLCVCVYVCVCVCMCVCCLFFRNVPKIVGGFSFSSPELDKPVLDHHKLLYIMKCTE